MKQIGSVRHKLGYPRLIPRTHTGQKENTDYTKLSSALHIHTMAPTPIQHEYKFTIKNKIKARLF